MLVCANSLKAVKLDNNILNIMFSHLHFFRYIFTVSFRNVGKILHSRIDLSKSGYSLFDHTGYRSIAELVEDAVAKSKSSVYCYTKPRDELHPHMPVRLTLPVSRYDNVPSLRCLSRLVIKQYVIENDMDKLPLPVSLIDYLKERCL